MYSKGDNATVDNIDYQATELSDRGSSWELEELWMPTVDPWSPIYTDILEPFDYGKYTAPRLPIDLGPVETDLIKQCPRVLRVTIKPEATLEVRLPLELTPVEGIVRRLLNYEMMINPGLIDFNVHLTLDYGFVEAGKTQRFPGWHGDGLQGGQFKEKLVCEHSYIAASSPGPELCLQPFFIQHLNEDRYNFFKVFDQQAKEENVYQTLGSHIYLMDPYIVHRTPTITEDTERAFIRLTIANRELPSEHNTPNPMWSQPAFEPKLDIRDFVLEPDAEILWNHYGLAEQEQVQVTEGDPQSPQQSEAPFRERELSGFGREIEVEPMVFPRVQPWSPTYADIEEPFCLFKYTNPRLPIDLGATDLSKVQDCPSVLRMPLKLPGDEHFSIPEEFLPILPLLTRLFTYERGICSRYLGFAAHITIDNRNVEPGSTQRFPGFHGDDLQGGIFNSKVITAHSYIITSEPATEVCLQPFFVAHLHDTFEKVFDEFDRQARPENTVKVLGSHVYLVDPYNVHRSPVITEPVERTFLRITFSPADMLLPHNTINPMLANRYYPGDDAIHLNESRFLVTPDRDVPYNFYALQARSAQSSEQSA